MAARQFLEKDENEAEYEVQTFWHQQQQKHQQPRWIFSRNVRMPSVTLTRDCTEAVKVINTAFDKNLNWPRSHETNTYLSLALVSDPFRTRFTTGLGPEVIAYPGPFLVQKYPRPTKHSVGNYTGITLKMLRHMHVTTHTMLTGQRSRSSNYCLNLVTSPRNNRQVFKSEQIGSPFLRFMDTVSWLCHPLKST